MPEPETPVDEEAEAEEREAEERRRRIVGHLQTVPHVLGAADHLNSARKRASRVTHSAGIRNEAERERNRSARSLDVLMKELSVPLGRYVASFPDPERLHAFERELLQLTVGEPLYRATLQRVDRLRKAVQEVGKSAASRAANAPNKATAKLALEEGMAAIETVFTAGSKHVEALKNIARSLRSLPSLDTGLPTLALVGAPNVGKSSLVNILSSGTPEVCNYPFTTRSIKMGHFYLDAQKHQVTDTPGLLARPDAERNRMERLTLAALGCLDSAVLFVTDLTEECGTSAADQWSIRGEMRARFPDRPWIDVLSKADMLEDVFEAADRLAPAAAQGADATEPSGSQSPATSGHAAHAQGDGSSSSDGVEGAAGGEAAPSTPVQVAARLPAALRISSLTHDGIPGLQLEIIRVLRSQAAARLAASRAAEEEERRARAAGQGLPQLLPPHVGLGPGGPGADGERKVVFIGPFM